MSVNNDNFLIEQDDISISREICAYIDNTEKRSIAVSNVIASRVAAKYFKDIEVDVESGLHNIFQAIDDIDISDIYIKGNYIDVRLYFNEDNIYVPKSQFDMGVLPAAYMFIKLDESISEGSVTGFILPENIDTNEHIDNKYKVNEDDLVSYYDIEQRFVNVDDCELSENIEKDIYDYLDNHISDKKEFYSQLICSKYARELLIGAAHTKNIFSHVDFGEFVLRNTEPTTTVDTASNVLEEDMPTEDLSLIEYDAESIDNIVSFDAVEGIDMLEEVDNSMLIEHTMDNDIADSLKDDDKSMILEENDNIEADKFPIDEYSDSQNLENYSAVSLQETEEDLHLEQSEENVPINNEVQDSVQGSESVIIDNESVVTPLLIEPENITNEITEQNDEITEVTTAEPLVSDEIDELSKFDYSTEITPSISSVENTEDELLNDLEATDEIQSTTTETVEVGSVEMQQAENGNSEQINALFANENGRTANVTKKKSSSIPVLILIALLCAAGYFGYNKFYVTSKLPADTLESEQKLEEIEQKTNNKSEEQVAMPVETVENDNANKISNEGTSVSIPAIEQNLDATVQVSNLSINWEVPSSYTTNSTAKRYFVRMGKIVQLKVKTELMSLSATPITNKISLELEFDNSTSKFKVKGIVDSSGVSKIDNVVKTTVEKALNINLNMNMSVFKNLQGNPVLIIKL